MVKIGPKLGLICPFPPFLQINFCVFVETSLKSVHTFLMGHILKFPAKKIFFLQGGLPGGPEFLSRFAPICWDIFHKLLLNNMLLAIRVPLKHIFFNCLGLSNGPENDPKLAQNTLFHYFAELFLVLLLKLSSKQYRVSQWVIRRNGNEEKRKWKWKFQGQKQRPLEIPYYFFLVTLGNSTTFLINPWKFYMLFL